MNKTKKKAIYKMICKFDFIDSLSPIEKVYLISLLK